LGWTTGVALCVVATAAAAPIFDSQGFENPPYNLGDLEGQEGWQLADGGTGPGTAVVQSTVTKTGTQAVQVNRIADSDDRWGQPVGAGFPTGQYIVVEWDMNVTQTPPGQWGPFMGSEAYDESTPSTFLLVGSLGVDATTGDVLYQAQGTGFLTETGTIAPFGVWRNYKMVLDYGTNNYTVYYEGTPLVTEGFVDPGITAFTDADISALAAFSDPASQAAIGTAYFDNFKVTPEPSSLALMLLGGVFCIARRRRG